MLLDEVFAHNPDGAAPLPRDEEVALIAAAKEGDESATLALARQYVGLMTGWVDDLAGQDLPPAALEEARAAALCGLLEAVAAFDPAKHRRLASPASRTVSNAVCTACAPGAVVVPQRTRTRYFGIMRAAGEDVERAAELAPAHGMRASTFLAVRRAMEAGALALDDADPATGANAYGIPALEPTAAEDAELVEVAFRAVDDDEERICRLAYGFTEPNPQPDAEIAHRMGLTRPTVQRRRGRALDKMRDALALTDD